MSKARPLMDDTKTKIQGKDVLVYINFGENASYDNPVWCLIGGQTKGDLSMKADSIDANNKTSDGWGEQYPGIKSTELSIEGIRAKSDEGLKAVKDAFVKGEAVDIVRYSTDGTAERNWYNITQFDDAASADGMAQYSITLAGKGKPKFYEGLSSVDDVKSASPISEE